jgi:hypothetical protein
MSKIGDSIKTAADSAKDSLATAKAKTTQSTAAARATAAEAYEKGKGKTSDGIDKNPLAIVLGGMAIGAIVGALLPRTERETKILGKAGKKLNKKARKMADAAKAAGKDQVESLGLNGDALRLQFRDLVSKAALAVKAASQAATDAAKEK